jgi:hypothetical protein
METLNAITLVCEGKNYKIIPYHEIYCAKRAVRVEAEPFNYNGVTYNDHFKVETIMLNGYTLCTEIKKKSLSELDVTSGDKYETDRAIVSFLGSPNEAYLNPTYTEFTGELNVGDTILFDKKYRKIYLERVLYASKFSTEQLFLVVPRRRIACVL